MEEVYIIMLIINSIGTFLAFGAVFIHQIFYHREKYLGLPISKQR